MNEKTKEFLKYMLGDYMDCCICDFVNNDDFPFNEDELLQIKEDISKLVEEE